ncbi:MAG TPA: tRNA (adenosine(37)-N6)-threonylcarbamoyltransferase complex dimerization subunit type 1 TsaB [Chthonomonadaceae bacterium]|nr:tRNA (adenosine(37)-N6)-threonylcarbamoyltransferase complex dimerization subunit type 1 TsaB [Chthonomonadaceae bacterium]
MKGHFVAEPATPDLILAMDTSGDVCSVALLRGGRLQMELNFRHEMRLSERLLAHVDMLLDECAATLDEVDGFAVGVGPGSFTGTRIGVVTVKTWAHLLPRPVVAIGSLHALAAEYAGLRGAIVVPVLPCRSGVVYTAAYTVDAELPAELLAPAALSFAELGAALAAYPDHAILFCGPTARRYDAELRGSLGNRSDETAFGAAEYPRAGTIGRLALARLRAADPLPPALELTPLYVSPPPISTPKSPLPSPPATS